MAIIDIFNAVIGFNEKDVAEYVHAEIERGTEPAAIINGGIVAPLNEIGKRFSAGEIYMPEMMMAGKAAQEGLKILRSVLGSTKIKSKGTVVIGTVEGDLHDIGKNLVKMMLEGGGFTVIDLGVNVPTDKFMTAIQENKPQIVALSALLTTTMSAMETTAAAIKNDMLDIRIMVGGAPVTQKFADIIGADGYSEDAPGAVELALKFVSL